eukprot:11166394-Lingulodinium_polyedra.AAC.1
MMSLPPAIGTSSSPLLTRKCDDARDQWEKIKDPSSSLMFQHTLDFVFLHAKDSYAKRNPP